MDKENKNILMVIYFKEFFKKVLKQKENLYLIKIKENLLGNSKMIYLMDKENNIQRIDQYFKENIEMDIGKKEDSIYRMVKFSKVFIRKVKNILDIR